MLGSEPRTEIHRRLLALILAGFAALPGCAHARQAPGVRAAADPHALVQRGNLRLRSQALDISLPYQEDERGRSWFGIIRLTNRTRTPIYPQLARLMLERPGQEPEALPLACERFRSKFLRLAPTNTLWCADIVNPTAGVDLPVELPASVRTDASLEFDLVIPIVFDKGDPMPVRFGNKIDRGEWRLTPARSRNASSAPSAPASPVPPGPSPPPEPSSPSGSPASPETPAAPESQPASPSPIPASPAAPTP